VNIIKLKHYVYIMDWGFAKPSRLL